MGNLFSNADNERQIIEEQLRQQRLKEQRLRQQQWIIEENKRREDEMMRRIAERIELEEINRRKREIEDKKRLEKFRKQEEKFIKFKQIITTKTEIWPLKNNEINYSYISDLNDYDNIRNLFTSTMGKIPFELENIIKIENVFLKVQFSIKKAEMTKLHGFQNTRFLFHGTKADNVLSICKNNFDWRLHGSSLGHRFGKGVSFTPLASYAYHYTDKIRTEKKILVAEILINNTIEGTPDTIIPPYLHHNDNRKRYDTTVNKDKTVFVKYVDEEYYPAYIITFKSNYNSKSNVKKPKSIPLQVKSVKKSNSSPYYSSDVEDGY